MREPNNNREETLSSIHDRYTEDTCDIKIPCSETENKTKLANATGGKNAKHIAYTSRNSRLSLERKLYEMNLNNFGSINGYIDAVLDAVNNLSKIGKVFEDVSIAAILLAGLPSNYKSLIQELENSDAEVTCSVVIRKLLLTKYDVIQLNKKERKVNNSLVTFTIENDVTDKEWYIDSGASSHMCSRLDWMENIKSILPSQVIVANGDVIECGGIGNISISTSANVVNKISDVVYVSELTTNLVSVKQAVDRGFAVLFNEHGCNMYRRDDFLFSGTSVLHGSEQNGLYVLDCIVNTPRESSYQGGFQLWDRCLGYLCEPAPQPLKDCAGIGKESVVKGPCLACVGNARGEPLDNNAQLKGANLEL